MRFVSLFVFIGLCFIMGAQSWAAEDWVFFPYTYLEKGETLTKERVEHLLNLEDDPTEARNLTMEHPERLSQMREQHKIWKESAERSARGQDYK